MKMLRAFRSILGFVVVVVATSSAVPSSPSRHTDAQESLKNALDAVTRKQRSLDYVPQDYYNELRSFNFHPGDSTDDKFERERQLNQDLDDDDDEDLEFLPLDNGQLENIGGGYQNFNNKRLERALIDYLENPAAQRDNAPSPFRERERSGGHKRGLNMPERSLPSDDNKELAALFYKELQNGPSYNTMGDDLDNQDYLLSDTLQSYYDRYRAEENKLDRNKLYESSSGPMSWGEIFGKQEYGRSHASHKNEQDMNDDDLKDRDRDQEPLYLLPAERRNVNGRYPLGREYGVLLKRYPLLTKRSPKPLQSERQNAGVITDPKVAKDLGALFGSQTVETNKNKTHDHHDKMQHAVHENDQHHVNGERPHSHEHDHEKEHAGHQHDNDDHGIKHATSSEAPNGTDTPLTTDKHGQKEISNDTNKAGKPLSKRDHRSIQVKKKSIDWSDYFGIDRRKKKAAFLARPGSQDQDDQWMLQRYYKTMAENLKSSGKNSGLDKDSGEKRDKLDQMDTRLKNVKNLIVEDALKYGSGENSDAQEVKDTVMARLAAAYSLEKMRRALNEFRSNIAYHRQFTKAAHAKNNTTSNFRVDSKVNGNRNNEKRNENSVADDETNLYEGKNFEGVDEGRGCPELESIERSCRPAKALIAGLYEPCVMHQICKACDDEEECSNIFAAEAAKVCENIETTQDVHWAFGHCTRTTLFIWKMKPSPIASAVCHASADSCLRRQYRYRNRALYYQNAWLPHISYDGAQLRER